MNDVHFYSTNVEWKEGRIGELTTSSFPPIKVATPLNLKVVSQMFGPPNICLSLQ